MNDKALQMTQEQNITTSQHLKGVEKFLESLQQYPQNFNEFESIPELLWSNLIITGANDYPQRLAEVFIAGANFARSIIEKEINHIKYDVLLPKEMELDAIKRENELLKANLVQADAVDKAKCGELDRLIKERDDLQEALRDLFMFRSGL